MPEENKNSSVFDISDEVGINESERLLMKLCRKSFLSLWSYANLFTDEGIREGKGSAKEFTDVLVVFGDDVVLFSDKHISFHLDQPLEVAWKRWFKRAIKGSADQLHGALSWLRRFPQRIFIDARCTRPLPIALPPADRARYHLVAVTRGSLEACAKNFPGSLGTLLIDTNIEGNAHLEAPFTVGVLDRNKNFVHIFDEFSLEVVLSEFDTINDFLEYLRAREKLLSNAQTVVTSAGEEQLVASYLLNMDKSGNHCFLPQLPEGDVPDQILFDESHYLNLKDAPQYKAKKLADEDSYVWDQLVERFIRLGNPKLVTPELDQSNNETELALRQIASESRFRRRILVESLKQVVIASRGAPDKRRARFVTTKQDPEILYIFLVVPKKSDFSYEEYRRYRASFLNAYCRCAKLRFPQCKRFVGIGIDHPIKDYAGVSEDLIVYTCEVMTEEEREEAEKFRKELGILEEGFTVNHTHDDEFPIVDLPPEKDGEKTVLQRVRDKKKRDQRKKKMKNASRKKNRKK